MVKISGIDLLVFLLVCTSIWGSVLFSAAAAADEASAPSDSIEQLCRAKIITLEPCVDYANGKRETPRMDCCASASAMREKDPVCLCYVLQQNHNGNPNITSFGLHEDKMIQIPIVCDLKNSSISLCTECLNLSPGSPDYVFFTNYSTKDTSSPTKTDGSDGIMPQPDIVAAVAIVFFITWFMSIIPT